MKGLLIVITAAALALLIGMGQALAQPAATTPPAAGGQVKPGKVEGGGWGGCRFGHFRHFRRPMIGEKLGLTDPQKEQVKTILKAAREEARRGGRLEGRLREDQDHGPDRCAAEDPGRHEGQVGGPARRSAGRKARAYRTGKAVVKVPWVAWSRFAFA